VDGRPDLRTTKRTKEGSHVPRKQGRTREVLALLYRSDPEGKKGPGQKKKRGKRRRAAGLEKRKNTSQAQRRGSGCPKKKESTLRGSNQGPPGKASERSLTEVSEKRKINREGGEGLPMSVDPIRP